MLSDVTRTTAQKYPILTHSAREAVGIVRLSCISIGLSNEMDFECYRERRKSAENMKLHLSDVNVLFMGFIE